MRDIGGRLWQSCYHRELYKPYLPHGLAFLCSRRGPNLLFPAHCLLSKKLVAALIVTGESGAEKVADNNNKTILYTAVSTKVVQLKSIKAYATIPKGMMRCGCSLLDRQVHEFSA